MNQKPLVIFGAGQIAELAHFYFSRQADRVVAALTVDSAYIREGTLLGCPVVAFETIGQTFPADQYDMFIAVSYSKLNEVRKEKFLAAQAQGYALPSFISPQATVLNDGAIGSNCFILEDNTIQPFVKIGDNVTLWSGNHIGHHSVIGDHCFIASHVVVSGGVTIEPSCFIGVNATLRDHIRVGEKSVIGAGALILSDVEPLGVYMGQETPRSKVPSNRLRGL